MRRTLPLAARAVRVLLREGRAVGGPVEIQLPRGVRVRGRVVDRHGEGVGDVRLGFLNVAWSNELSRVQGLAITDAAGRFDAWSGVLQQDVGMAVYTRPGAPSLVHGWLQAPHPLLWPALVEVSLRFLAGAADGPLDGVAFATGSSGGPSEVPSCCSAWDTADAQGRARVALVPGTLTSTSGAHRSTGAFTLGNEALRAAARGAVVPDARGAELEIRVGARATPTLGGTVRDPQGRPIEGARVTHEFALARGRTVLLLPGATTTDVDGRYGFHVAQGHQWTAGRILAVAPGYAPIAVPLEATAEAGRTPLRCIAVVLTRGASLGGQVLDVRGRPLPGAHVFTRTPEVESILTASGDSFVTAAPALMEAVTDDDGRYTLTGIPFGADVIVRARHSTVVREGSVTVHTDRRARQSATALRLESGRALRVRVLGPGGLVRSGAQVRLVAGSRAFTQPLDHRPWDAREQVLTTGPEGEVLFRRCALGEHCLFATAASTAGVAAPLALEPGDQPLDVTVRLRHAAPIRATVRDHKGRLVGAMSILAVHPEGTEITQPAQWLPQACFEGAGGGRFEIVPVPAGLPVALQVDVRYFKSLRFTTRGGAAPLELTLEPLDAELLGRIELVEAQRRAVEEKYGTGL